MVVGGWGGHQVREVHGRVGTGGRVSNTEGVGPRVCWVWVYNRIYRVRCILSNGINQHMLSCWKIDKGTVCSAFEVEFTYIYLRSKQVQ